MTTLRQVRDGAVTRAVAAGYSPLTGSTWRSAIRILVPEEMLDRNAEDVIEHLHELERKAVARGLAPATVATYALRVRKALRAEQGFARRTGCQHEGVKIVWSARDSDVAWCQSCGALKIGAQPWKKPDR